MPRHSMNCMTDLCYCLALRLPVGPMHVPELTFGLLGPLEFLADFKTPVLCLNSLELRNAFQTVFSVSQQQHCIFPEGVDWCYMLFHISYILSSAMSDADLMYYITTWRNSLQILHMFILTKLLSLILPLNHKVHKTWTNDQKCSVSKVIKWHNTNAPAEMELKIHHFPRTK